MADRKIFANAGPSDPNLKRSVFDKSFYNNLTARFGRIYPVFLEEAPANSTYRIRPAFGFSVMPLVFPVQTNIRCHLAFFKAPFRILMKNYEDFAVGVGNHVMPFISRPDGEDWCPTGSLADYMGVPTFSAHSVQQLIDVGCRTQAYSGLDSGVVHWQHGYTLIGSNKFEGDLNYAFIAASAYTDYVGFCSSKLDSSSLMYDDYLKVPIIYKTAPVVATTHKMYLHVFVNGVDKYVQTFTGSASNSNTPLVGVFCKGTDYYTVSNYNGTGYRVISLIYHVDEFVKTLINESLTNGDNVNLCLVYSRSVSDVYGEVLHDYSSDDPSSHRSFADYFREAIYSYFNSDKLENIENFLGILPHFQYMSEKWISSSPTSSPFLGSDPELKINALPFRFYEMIYNYHFRNSSVDPLILDGNPTYNKFLTNDGDGADTTTPLSFKQAMFEPDIFTTCLPSPQLGYAPLVGITFNDGSDTATLHMVPSEGEAYDVEVAVDANSDALAISNYADVADKTTVKRLNEMINFGISINDLRNASALQRWCERRNKSGLIYHDYVFEMFGTHAPDGDHFPEYLGGFTQSVNVGKIENTSLTAPKGQSGPQLGEFAGTANCVGQAEEINVFCAEQSYIMGIMYFTVTPTYSQQLPAHLVKRELLDYYNPQFAHIGLQPVFNYQIAPLQADENTPGSGLRDVFGYNRPYGDYVQRLDEVHGDFRKESMQNFLLQRQFATMPHLNADFLNIKSQDLTDIFAVTLDSDKIYGQIYFDVKATLPIPRFMSPQIL